jgi:RNA polymerase sigma factor (sigma-70 family)
MTALLDRARSGDADAFAELTAPHRRELHVHCYRMLGSFDDADDAVQETLLAAWRGLAAFQGRASVRTWLYRVATNTCLNQVRTASRRPQMTEPLPATAPAPTGSETATWLQPYPDALLDALPDLAPGPDVRVEQDEAVSRLHRRGRRDDAEPGPGVAAGQVASVSDPALCPAGHRRRGGAGPSSGRRLHRARRRRGGEPARRRPDHDAAAPGGLRGAPGRRQVPRRGGVPAGP